MNWRTLIQRNLEHYWRTNLAVILGVGVATAVLSGALLVGDSVRASLRDLVVQRLGKADHAVVSTGFFREALGEAILQDFEFKAKFSGLTPMIVMRGFVSLQGESARAGNVAVYGVDDRFWRFHNVAVEAIAERDALLSPALAAELGATAGAGALVRIQRPSDMPLESLQGRKDDASRTVRAKIRGVLARPMLGEFSLQAQQGEVRAIFLPLALLQDELDMSGRVNTLLIAGGGESTTLEPVVRRLAAPDDLGLQVRTLPNGAVVLDSRSGVLDDATARTAVDAAAELPATPQQLLTYLANNIKVGERELPYSLVTAMDLPPVDPSGLPPILLNDWAARDLRAKVGDALTMDYFVWMEPGQLITRTSEFRVAGIVPLGAGDPDFAPRFPGITDAAGIRDWDPPFPLDLRRVRAIDEEYFDKYSTTPKAFVPLEVGQSLWRTRYGALTSIRFTSNQVVPDALRQNLEDKLRTKINPLASGLAVVGVRSQSLDASRGATNFGEYFVYFSFFLVISALLLSALFFKLTVEQRIREVGLLRAVGFAQSGLRRLFLAEGLILSAAGAIVGAVGAIAYAWAILWALRTLWTGAVGTQELFLHLSASSVAIGAIGGVFAAVACIALTLRGLQRISERSLLAGELRESSAADSVKRRPSTALLLAATALLLLIAGASGAIPADGAFFGTGFCLLGAALFYQHWRLGRQIGRSIAGNGWQPLSSLALRNASFRPARSVTAMAAIAAAAFIVISVDAFRKDDAAGDPGGYALMVETLSPIAHDPNSAEGRRSLNLEDLQAVHFEPFRLRPGDDASCLNLYEPKNPQILAPRDSFIQAARFAFQSSLAASDAETQNPWTLLNKPLDDGAIPVIADANSLTYVLHRKLGDDFLLPNGADTVRLRFVAALSDSIFQGALLMSEANFLKLFPAQQGYSMLLAETSAANSHAAAEIIETALTDYSADVTPTASRLAEFHRVENTYLSTFQMLGGLGLLLGTAGLAAVLLRSVLERRRELALLRVLGYTEGHLFLITLVENVALLVKGLLIGGVCAVIAIAPAMLDRGGRLPAIGLAPLFAAILLLGLVIAALATKAALRGPVLSSLRSE